MISTSLVSAAYIECIEIRLVSIHDLCKRNTPVKFLNVATALIGRH